MTIAVDLGRKATNQKNNIRPLPSHLIKFAIIFSKIYPLISGQIILDIANGFSAGSLIYVTYGIKIIPLFCIYLLNGLLLQRGMK